MSGSTGPNLPVRIEVQGTQQAEAQFNQVGQAGAAAMGRVQRGTEQAAQSTGGFRNAVGQAGFQVQDFAVQVQSGTSALTALAQQGSQFLGVFGPAGAMAGAALVAGILAVQLLGLSESTDDAAEAAKRLEEAERAFQDALRTTIELTETAEERSARLTRERVSGAQLGLIAQRGELEARRYLILQEMEAQRRAANAPVAVDPFGAGREFLTEPRRDIEGLLDVQGFNAQLDAITADLSRIEEAERRLRNVGVERGQGQYGPEAPTAGRTAMGVVDVQAVVAARLAELTQQYDAYSQALNLSTAGLERAAPALRAYAEQQALLTQLLDAGVISEAEFTAEVERSSIALEEQIRIAEQRADRASGAANQLGFSFSSAFEDAIIEGKALSDVLKGLEQDIARIIIRSAITRPLGNAISGVVTAGVSNFFGAPAGPVDGMRATGGPVFPGGTYLVGERGPELLTMGAAGHVTPNAGGPSITQNFNIDARGADAGVVPRLRAEMVAVARAANAELLAEIQRGGRAASIVGRR